MSHLLPGVGMGKRHLAPRVLSLVSGLFGVGQKMYCENMNRIWVVNAPSLFELAFSVVKPALHQNTIDKIQVVSHPNTKALAEVLGGIQYVPTFLGGTDPDCAIGHVEPPADSWTTVRAGMARVELIPLAVSSGHRKVVARFRTRSFAVRFSAVLLPRGASPGDALTSIAETLLPPSMYDAHAYPQHVEISLPERPSIAGGDHCVGLVCASEHTQSGAFLYEIPTRCPKEIF
jgi:hypothetical protein